MEEDRTPSAEAPAVTELKRESETGGKRPFGLMIVGVLLVIGLIITGLFLPPISLGQRLGLTGNTDTPAENGEPAPQATAASSNLSLPGEIDLVVSNGVTGVNVAAQPATDFVAPANQTIVGNVYNIVHDGTATGNASVVIPAGAAPETLDLYGWNGNNWTFMPSVIDTTLGQIVSAEGTLPQAVALMSASAATAPSVAAEVLPAQTLPVELLPHLTEVSVGTLTLNQDGSLLGEPTAVPTGAYTQLLRVTNTGAIVDQASLTALLSDPNLQTNHINELVNRVSSGGFVGLNLDYQGATTGQRQLFSTFVNNLATALHGQGLTLAVTLATPVNVEGQWDSLGQDWAVVGSSADVVYAQLPADPSVYTPAGNLSSLLNWATRQVARDKLTALVSSNAIDHLGEVFLEISNQQAFSRFGTLQFITGAAEVEPETAVEVALSGTASPLTWDGNSATYTYNYDDNGQSHTVWLGNPASLGQKLALIKGFNLRGAIVRGLGSVTDGAGYATALQSYLGTAESPQPTSAAIVWKVEDAQGNILGSATGDALTFAWEGTAEPGNYTVQAEFSLGEDITSIGTLAVAVVAPVAEVTPEPTSPPVTSGGTNQPTTDGEPGTAVVNLSANIRLGPGVTYGTIAGGIATGTVLQLIGRNEDASWLQVVLPDNQTEAWIFASLVTVQGGFDVTSLAIVEVDPPVAGGGDNSGGGNSPPPAPPPPGGIVPVANSGFELGGQTHTLSNPQLMSYAGMTWVKFQHKWGSGDSPSAVAGRISQAQANGFKVLLSIPGANTYPSSIEFAEYVDFLGGVAALGPNAIEVWNEMNIDFEWPAGQIDPASYVNNMLAPAYNKIKAANPNVMVISGAPAPTGFDNGTNAWADNRYVAGMAAAGAAAYMDCIGVHHNAGATSPGATSGHPTGSAHYSWYFNPTLNMYYNAFGGARPVCFTELGYLSGEDFGGVPSRFGWASGTTVAQHAQWLGEAASLSGNSGKVRLMVVFNVDFTLWGDDPQAGYAMIRPSGSCPACETLRQAMGR